MFKDFKLNWVDPDWESKYKLASFWTVVFWGAVGGLLIVLPVFLNIDNVGWLGGIIVVMSISFAVARFYKQPGTM